MTLKERLMIITEGCKAGYLIGQWNRPDGVYLASWMDTENGVYLHELLSLTIDLEEFVTNFSTYLS
jgi:hypothetical protein